MRHPENSRVAQGVYWKIQPVQLRTTSETEDISSFKTCRKQEAPHEMCASRGRENNSFYMQGLWVYHHSETWRRTWTQKIIGKVSSLGELELNPGAGRSKSGRALGSCDLSCILILCHFFLCDLHQVSYQKTKPLLAVRGQKKNQNQISIESYPDCSSLVQNIAF